jgi:flagellar biosynthetic protein FlhB
LGRLSLLLAVKISAVLLVLAMFDFAYQKFEFASNLKMTRQEVREELKDTEGNPVIKARVRQIQREMARQRMMQDIPKADIVITNPTHLAVALKYNPADMPAPMVVAKGQRLLAEKIKEIAREHKVPVIENKPLAQSLFKVVDVGAYIPATLYRAVAEVLAYIYRLKENGGFGRG